MLCSFRWVVLPASRGAPSTIRQGRVNGHHPDRVTRDDRPAPGRGVRDTRFGWGRPTPLLCIASERADQSFSGQDLRDPDRRRVGPDAAVSVPAHGRDAVRIQHRAHRTVDGPLRALRSDRQDRGSRSRIAGATLHDGRTRAVGLGGWSSPPPPRLLCAHARTDAVMFFPPLRQGRSPIRRGRDWPVGPAWQPHRPARP